MASDQVSTAPWKPKPWLAALLGVLTGPFAMLYVLRPWWALFYAALSLPFGLVVERANLPFPLSLALVAAITCHAFVLATRSAGAEPRPWYSRPVFLAPAIAMVVMALVGVRAFVIETFRSTGEGMSPTVPPGVMLFLDKRGYGHYTAYGLTLYRTAPSKVIRRGELVVFDKPREPAYPYLKRVIGLPGDVVEYVGKRLRVNGQAIMTTVVMSGEEGELLEEMLDGLKYRVQTYSGRESRDYSVRVGEDEYFVLGDNRDNSADSRHFGPVPARNLVGRVVATW